MAVIVGPVHELSFSPIALPLNLVLDIDDPANAMLHAILPLAPILAPVRVRVGALSVLLVAQVVTFVAFAIWPHVDAVAVHNAVHEGTMEGAAVRPLEAAVAIHFIVAPHAYELGAIGPEVAPFALLHALIEQSIVKAAVGPNLNAFPS